jgi:hypothetical protein
MRLVASKRLVAGRKHFASALLKLVCLPPETPQSFHSGISGLPGSVLRPLCVPTEKEWV